MPEYRLGFTRYSTKRKGGVADIVPEPGATTWGEGRGFIDAEPLRPMALDRNPIERREKFYTRIMKRTPDVHVYRRAPNEYGLMVNDGLARNLRSETTRDSRNGTGLQ